MPSLPRTSPAALSCCMGSAKHNSDTEPSCIVCLFLCARCACSEIQASGAFAIIGFLTATAALIAVAIAYWKQELSSAVAKWRKTLMGLTGSIDP